MEEDSTEQLLLIICSLIFSGLTVVAVAPSFLYLKEEVDKLVNVGDQ